MQLIQVIWSRLAKNSESNINFIKNRNNGRKRMRIQAGSGLRLQPVDEIIFANFFRVVYIVGSPVAASALLVQGRHSMGR